MTTIYNLFQGRSLERLAALSDGIFAVAMTLLVLDVHAPPAAQIHSEQQLIAALCALFPQWIAYGMSFLTLGIFWAGQQTQIANFRDGTRDLTWINLGFLFTVTLVPFSTRLLAEFIGYRFAVGVYWLNILAMGAMLLWTWNYADRNSLIREEITKEFCRSVYKRILIAQALYAASAALCFIHTGLAIAAMVLVQLNYAIAPRFLSGFVDGQRRRSS